MLNLLDTALATFIGLFVSGTFYLAYLHPDRFQPIAWPAMFISVATSVSYIAWLAGVDAGRTEMLAYVNPSARLVATVALPTGSIHLAWLLTVFAGPLYVGLLWYASTLRKS